MALPTSINFRISQIDPASMLPAPGRQSDMSGGSDGFDRHLNDTRRSDDSAGDRAIERRDDQRQRDRAEAARDTKKSDEDTSSQQNNPTDQVTQPDVVPAPVAAAIPTPTSPITDKKAGDEAAASKVADASPGTSADPQAGPLGGKSGDKKADSPADGMSAVNGTPVAANEIAAGSHKTETKGNTSTGASAPLAPAHLAAHVGAPAVNVRAPKASAEADAQSTTTTPLPVQAPLVTANTGAGAKGTETPSDDANADDALAIQPKEGLGHQAASHMAEKSDAKSADAAQPGNSPSPAAAAVTATPTTFAKSASAAPGENISAISATSATDAGGPARLSDIQNIGNTSQTQTSTTATVRIGTLPGQTLPTQVPAMTIALQIARNLQKGINRFDIRLDPAEMGRIDVRMEVHRDGHVAAHLTVDRPETLDLLQRDARSLQQALSDAGLQANADSLNFSLRDQNAGGNAPGFGANHANSSPASGPAAPNEVAAAGPVYNINLAANGGVDIRV